MSLGVDNVALLTLTMRKSDCQLTLAEISGQKMALARSTTNLSQTYNSKLQATKVSYYANGQYNNVDYKYLMGYGHNFAPVLDDSTLPLKNNYSMILADHNGRVVLSEVYAQIIRDVLGVSCADSAGRGKPFSLENIAKMISKTVNGIYTEDQIKAVMNDEEVSKGINALCYQTTTGDQVGSTTMDVDSTAAIKSIIDFYYPIFIAAANNGWTTEYNKEIATNDDYISDAILSGILQLEAVDANGDYNEETTLEYFLTIGAIEENLSAEEREKITAWYEAEKEVLKEKETFLDLQMNETSTELEAINAEIQSIQSLLDDTISSVFDWGSA